MKLKPEQLNFFSKFDKKFYTYSENMCYEIDNQLKIINSFKIDITLPKTLYSNVYQTFQNKAIVNQKIYEFKGQNIVEIKDLKKDGYPTISKEQKFVFKDQIFDLNLKVVGNLTFIPKQKHQLYFFNDNFAIETEEETVFYNYEFVSNQEVDSQLKGILLTFKDYIVDDQYTYLDISTGVMVYPINDSVDLMFYQCIDVYGQLSLKKEILEEYQLVDYLDQPIKELFGFKIEKIIKQDEQ